MTRTLRLHYAPDNASLIVRLALEELGLPYETALVDRRRNAQDSPAYRTINPAGLIPALETPDGPIFETGAILLWLADRQGRMAPSHDSPERGAFLKWLFYLSNALHANLRLNFYPEKHVGPDSGTQTALRTGARANLQAGFGLMDGLATQGHGWFAAASPSVLDLYLCAMLRWSALYPSGDTAWFRLADYPALESMAARLEKRASVAALCAAEGMASCPFTTPQHPTPPEGSAL